jgi:hypothetical protein
MQIKDDAIKPVDPIDEQIDKCNAAAVLDVVIVVSNPVMYHRRYQLFEEFIRRYKTHSRVRMHTTELQQGNKPYATSAEHKFRTKHEIWHKENLINLVVQRLPKDWKYLAWIDSDIEFHNANWVEDTISQLQHYKVVQLFSHAIDMGPDDEAMNTFESFGYRFARGLGYTRPGYGKFSHPGYAWAMTRRAYNKVGGLVDFAILGSADTHMALAFIGKVELSINRNLHQNYQQLLKRYQERCKLYINENVGYVKGTILHHWHGKKKDRQYSSRWLILIEHNYDPLMDIYRDAQGLYQLSDHKPEFRDALRRYFRARNEDSVDM